jgi:8-oxo-dGTP pyrophosphatase MutT (NUDIX family)
MILGPDGGNMQDRLEPVRTYLGAHAGEGLRLLAQIDAPDDMCSRKNMAGHVTASGLVVTPDYREVLLIAHNGVGKWLQPGGHVDEDDAEIWQAAAREIREETGIAEVSLHPWHAFNGGQPADIDTHQIAARPAKGEGDHWHHDCMFIFVAEKARTERQEAEVAAACWCPINDERVPPRLRRVYDAVLAAEAEIDERRKAT